MNSGDILVELRAWRDEFARSHGYDLGAMVAALRELDGAAGERIVRGEPRQPVAVLPLRVSSPNQALHPRHKRFHMLTMRILLHNRFVVQHHIFSTLPFKLIVTALV